MTIVAKQPKRTNMIMESFIVNFVRAAGATEDTLQGSDQQENMVENENVR